MNDDDLDIPAFLDRRGSGTKMPMVRLRATKPKLIWTPKKNWRKVEERKRKRQKAAQEAFKNG